MSDLQDLIHSTVMKAVTLGTEHGVETERTRIVDLLRESDSACSEWAIALIEDNNDG